MEVAMQRLAAIAPAEVRTVWGSLSAIPDPGSSGTDNYRPWHGQRSVERHGDGGRLALRQPIPDARRLIPAG
ncbi:hypothetical protein ACLK2H_08150 [Escherichia coli]